MKNHRTLATFICFFPSVCRQVFYKITFHTGWIDVFFPGWVLKWFIITKCIFCKKSFIIETALVLFLTSVISQLYCEIPIFVKVLSHWIHLYGFSPVYFFKCIVRYLFLLFLKWLYNTIKMNQTICTLWFKSIMKIICIF